MFHKKKLSLTAAAAGLLLAATGCSGGGKPNDTADSGSGGAAAPDSGLTIAMVTHEQPGTTFWDRVRAGAEQAAKQHGIKLKYSNDPEASKQSTLVKNAIDSKVDGVAVTLATPDAVGPSLKSASDAGIPTVALNAGLDAYKKYGALMYFGSDEKLAGQTAGKRLADEGAKKILCIVHAAGVISLEDRCAGVRESAMKAIKVLLISITALIAAMIIIPLTILAGLFVWLKLTEETDDEVMELDDAI